MIRMVWRGLVQRLGRSIALGLAVLVAGTGFTVLSASSNASRLETTGVVQDKARTVYDILVRPPGSRSEVETRKSLVQPGFLTGGYGGISIKQWRQIQALSGVDVAAPVAVLGYALPRLEIPVSTSDAWREQGDSVARVDVSWSWDNGLSRERQVPDFTFVTEQALRPNRGASAYDGFWKVGTSDRGICPVDLSSDQRPATRPSRLICFSRTAGGQAHMQEYSARHVRGLLLSFPLPYVVAAIDPASESELVGLDHARSSGASLQGFSTRYPAAISGEAAPVLVADRIDTQQTATITVSRLNRNAAQQVMRGVMADQLRPVTRHKVSTSTITAQQAHQTLLQQFRTAKPVYGSELTTHLPGDITQLGLVSLPHLDLAAPTPRVKLGHIVEPDVGDLQDGVQYKAPGSSEPPARDVSTSHVVAGTGAGRAMTLRMIGTYDTARLHGLDDLTAQILSGYDAAPTRGADARSRKLLGDRPMQPSGVLSGFLQPPPMMLTSMEGSALLTEGFDQGNDEAPISAVRVRVTGVTGVDEASRERVRLAAQRIRSETGLQVDIVTGSSPTRQTVTLPAGDHGRPAMSLTQWWVKKGVALSVIDALDKKSLALFVLVLLISALSVANATVSSVRSRRTELGVLASLGWRRRDLFRLVLAEVTLISTAAGLTAAVLSMAIGRIIGTPISWQRASLAIPAALLVAMIAGMVPAWLAARSDPMDAVRSAVSEPKRAHHPRSLFALAVIGVGRVKTRTTLASVGLAVAVLVFTVLLAITLAFQGAVVGTVLGDAVAIQARGADYAATGATLLLAFLGVANVIYLNIRDRGSELATLRAVGWTEPHLVRLIVTEGLLLGLLGATPGATLGVVVAVALTGNISTAFVIGAAAAWLTALVLAALAATLAARLVRRLPTTLLLTE